MKHTAAGVRTWSIRTKFVKKGNRPSPFSTAQKQWILDQHKEYDAEHKAVAPLHALRLIAQRGIDIKMITVAGGGDNALKVVTEQIRWFMRTYIEMGHGVGVDVA